MPLEVCAAHRMMPMLRGIKSSSLAHPCASPGALDCVNNFVNNVVQKSQYCHNCNDTMVGT